jgi:hypothetical protein
MEVMKMKNNNTEYWVVDVNKMYPYSYSNSKEGAEELLQKALRQQEEDIKTWEGHIKNYPEAEHFKNYLTDAKNKQYKIMSYDEYKQLERNYFTSKPLTEITAEQFNEMLNVLPPLKWCTKHNIEMFCMSEMLTGTYTSQYMYNLVTNKYYHKIVDITDQTTWGFNFIQ